MNWTLVFVGASLMASTALADIYMYRDSRGVLHFSNAPAPPEYQYYIPDLAESGKRPTTPKGESKEAKGEKLHSSGDPVSQRGRADDHDTDNRKPPPTTAGLAEASRENFASSDAEASAVLVFTILAAVAGYSMVAFVVRKVRESPLRTKARSSDSSEHYQTGAEQEEQFRNRNDERAGHEEAPRGTLSEEQDYARVLGLKGQVTRSDVKKAYRQLLAKYHPDKVDHLGEEFKDIAEEKTKAIVEAYAYFRKKYGIA